MPASALAQILLLLGSAVAIVLVFQRLRIPSVLAYLLIGVLLGPYTAGPVVAPPLRALAVRRAGVDWLTAWRTGMLLAVGGEFGFALLALGLQAQVLGETLAQIAHRGQPLSALPTDGVVITALVRAGQRRLQPAPETLLEGGDTLVLFGPPEALARAEARLLA
ncbi:MAG: TrkA C-terminal domain-containing protein [Rubrivivax sp.]|nr:TrkA C-terminal domain-containing protein [Rubrivivax sp.]